MTLNVCCIEGCLHEPQLDAPCIRAIADTTMGTEEIDLLLCKPHRDAIVVVAQDEYKAPTPLSLSHV